MNFLFGILIAFFVIISNLFPFLFLENRENTMFEILQVIFIILSLFIHLKCSKLYLKFSDRFNFIIKSLFFVFLFYEEISFFSYDSNSYLTKINSQSEINIHNLNFFGDIFLKIEFPQINYTASIETYVIFVTFSLFILGYGSYLKLLNRFKILFLERKFSIYTYLFIINYVLSSLISKVINPSLTFMHFEFVELFIYFILLLDVIEKRKILKSYY